jgi:ferritin-like metal-binding protein YciE
MEPQTNADELLHELRELHSAEKLQTRSLPEMAQAATNPALASNLAHHAQETVAHVKRVEQVCRTLGVGSRGVNSDAVSALLSDASKQLNGSSSAAELDAGLISTAKEIEDYETKKYESVLIDAEKLGVGEAVEVLHQTLDEEKASQAKLRQLQREAKSDT